MNIAISDHRRRLLTLARRIGRGRLDPEDLAQDVLERWTRALPRLPPTTNSLAWMTVVLRRLAIDQLRHRRASPEMPAVCSGLPAVEGDPAPWWLELEIADVAHALGELPTELRATFQRFELDGKSYDEIASELQIAQGHGRGSSAARAPPAQAAAERAPRTGIAELTACAMTERSRGLVGALEIIAGGVHQPDRSRSERSRGSSVLSLRGDRSGRYLANWPPVPQHSVKRTEQKGWLSQ